MIFDYLKMDDLSIDDFLTNLNTISPKITHDLRQIKNIDQQALALQAQLQAKREQAISMVREHETTKSIDSKREIEQLLREISQLHVQLMKLSSEKVQITEGLYNIIDEPTERLDHFMNTHSVYEEMNQSQDRKSLKSKRGRRENELQEGDNGEPRYCYCGQISHGVMIKCDNPFCETEWFHTHCVEDKEASEKDNWFCKQCRESMSITKPARKGRPRRYRRF